jgi:ABC-type phosphate transport system substrate-binding protein
VGGDEDQLTLGNVDYVGSVNAAGSSAPINYPNLQYLYVSPPGIRAAPYPLLTYAMVCGGSPVAAFAITLMYNLPELRNAEPLVLDLPTVAQVYLGQITTWNHPAIQQYGPPNRSTITTAAFFSFHIVRHNRRNPGVTLPSNPIRIVLDSSSSYTYPFTLALSRADQNFSKAVGVGSNVSFPVSNPLMALTSGTRPFRSVPYRSPKLTSSAAYDDADVVAAVAVTQYTMAFAPHFAYAAYGATTGVSQLYPLTNGFANVTEATLINRADTPVRPTLEVRWLSPLTPLTQLLSETALFPSQAVQSAEAQAQLDRYLTADLSWAPGDGSWPITTYFYLLLTSVNDADCERATNLVDLAWWMLSAAQAENLNNLNIGTYHQLLHSKGTVTNRCCAVQWPDPTQGSGPRSQMRS